MTSVAPEVAVGSRTPDGGVATILLATDLSPRCEDAAARAVALATRWNAKLHVLTVVSPTVLMDDEPDDVPVAKARRQIEQSLQDYPKAIIHVLIGPADQTISELASDIQADLIVTGSSGGSWLGQTLLGGTLRHLMRKARVPLLLVKGPANREYRELVAAVDLSDASRAPVEAAVGRFGYGNALAIFHAFSTPFRLFSGDIDAYEAGVREGVSVAIRDALKAWSIKGAESIPIIAEYGDPAAKLSELVARHNVDLVAVGTHGRSGVMHLLLGSVAENIAEQVPCDVLIAPSRGAWAE